MKDTEQQPVYEMFWSTAHVQSNEDFDAKLVRFPGWENIAGWLLTRKYDLPDEIMFEANFSSPRPGDYPFNDVNWPLMSRRMLDALVSVGDFPHRAIPVRLVDRTVPAAKRRDSSGRLRSDIVDDRFVAVQLTTHLDVLDWERSEYEADPLFPDEVGIIRKLVLKVPSEGFPPLFRIEAKPRYLFVSTDAKRRLEQLGVYWFSVNRTLEAVG